MNTTQISRNGGIDTSRLFRLPWNRSDNAMTWFEPTRYCNLHCDACFHESDPDSRKSLDEIDIEFRALMALRKCDAFLIAGGEPLTHPDIAAITARVRSLGVKPVIITNGVGVTTDLLRTLKAAGLHAITFHVDAHQSRPGWIGATEEQLNELRQQLADMVLEVGGIGCSYNLTVFPDTLADMHHVVRWAVRNIDRVQVLTLIAVRMLHPDEPFEHFVHDRRIDIASTPYVSRERYRHITAAELADQIHAVLPEYEFNAFLGGTALAESTKWVLGTHVGSSGRSYGCSGPRMMELLQNGNHLFRRRYLAYTHPRLNRKGRSMLLLGAVDPPLRRAARRWIGDVLRHPSRLFHRLHAQSISVVQPVDTLPSGEFDNCDGCPNGTYWEGRIVPACRLEEYMRYGAPLHAVPERREAPTAGKDARLSARSPEHIVLPVQAATGHGEEVS